MLCRSYTVKKIKNFLTTTSFSAGCKASTKTKVHPKVEKDIENENSGYAEEVIEREPSTSDEPESRKNIALLAVSQNPHYSLPEVFVQ